MIMLFDIIIYHANCHDGFAAAAVVYKFLMDKFKTVESCKFIPAAYGSAIPKNIKNKRIIIVDFSYSAKEIEFMEKEAESVVIIDHHKSAIEKTKNMKKENLLLDMNNCGAVLAWKYFYGDKPIPLFLKYIEDRDMWWHKMEFSKEAFLGTTLIPKSFPLWNDLLDHTNDIHMNKIIENGKILKLKEDEDISNLLKSAYLKKLTINKKNFTVAYINSKLYRSELGHVLLEKYPKADFSASYFYNGYWNSTTFSLRSRTEKSFDVSSIAEKYGGGGHPCASGLNLKGINIQLPNINSSQLVVDL
jgi:uncharacterized protein